MGTGDDTTLVVDANGSASVTEQLRWHVVRGPLRAIDRGRIVRKAALVAKARAGRATRLHAWYLVHSAAARSPAKLKPYRTGCMLTSP